MMSYTVGAQVDLSTTVKDSSGTLVNATISLVVTKPDGTTTSPSVANPSTGVYTASISATLAGPWLYVWTASGAAVGVDDGQFEVTAQALRIVSLADVKRHMNMSLTDTTNDDEVQDFIDAAQALIEREIGPVVPKTYTERHNGGRCRINVDHGPIVSITSITEYYYGSLLHVLTSNEYVVDYTAGYIDRTLPSGMRFDFQGSINDVVIVYVAGRIVPVGANVRLGAKELTAHLWRNTQLGRTRRSRSGSATDDDSAPIGLGFSMPARVRELIGARKPVIY